MKYMRTIKFENEQDINKQLQVLTKSYPEIKDIKIDMDTYTDVSFVLDTQDKGLSKGFVDKLILAGDNNVKDHLKDGLYVFSGKEFKNFVVEVFGFYGMLLLTENSYYMIEQGDGIEQDIRDLVEQAIYVRDEKSRLSSLAQIARALGMNYEAEEAEEMVSNM